MTKFPCPLFLMIAKDCTERMSAVALSVGLILFRAANASRVTWYERVRHWNALTEFAWEDALQGLGVATPTVASEKNWEMLFIGNVFYKQWHLWVLPFHYCLEGTTSWKSRGNAYRGVREKLGNVVYRQRVLQTVTSLSVVSLLFGGHNLLKIANINLQQ